MKKLLLLSCIVAVCATCMVSCASDEPTLTVSDSHQTTDPNFISLDEALVNADNAFKSMLGKSKKHTRSNIDAELFMPRKTRSGQDGMYGFYVLNYGKDDGFALLSADRRRTPVFALSEEGSLHLSDTTDNKGLSWYVNERIATESIGVVRPPVGRDSIVEFDPFSAGIRTYYCEPMLTGVLSKFHQEEPYNKYCPRMVTREHALTGCGPIALGAILAYFQWPKTIVNYSFNWNDMLTQQNHDMWARLFEVIGRPGYLAAEYFEDCTGNDLYRVIPTLKNLGYGSGTTTWFSTSSMATELTAKRPVFMFGIGSAGHFWVADGGFQWDLNMIVNGEVIAKRREYFYHMVWGEGGKANGYFLCAEEIGGKPYIPDEGTSGTAEKYKDLKITYGYRPNK